MLNWFVLISTGKCFPFLHMLLKTQKWEKKCEGAFEQLKAYLLNSLVLNQTKPSEIFHLLATLDTFNMALVRRE